MSKILIVEDELQLRQALITKLKELNYEVFTAADPSSAQQQVKQNLPDLILLDIILPGGENGFDFLRSLKQSKKAADIPVIIITNLEGEEDTAKQMGAIDYLVKTDVSLDQIVAKIKSCLR